MRAMTEIEWLDGRVTKVPELALGDAFGESVQAELDFGFDDVLEGLWVVVRHHEPDEDSDGDPRGRGYALHADCRYSLVEPSDLDRDLTRRHCLSNQCRSRTLLVHILLCIFNVPKRMPPDTRKSSHRCHANRAPKPSAKTSSCIPIRKSKDKAGG